MSKASGFMIAVTTGMESGDWSIFDDWSYRESTQCGKHPYGDEPPIDASIICDVLELINEEAFLASDQAYSVLKFIETEWGRIPEDQRDLLLPALANSYDKFSNSMSRFLIAELLGEYYADERAFGALSAIKNRSTGPPRNLLPMAFQLIARHACNDYLRDKATKELLDLGKDNEPEEVREAAKIYLARLQAKS